MNITEKLLLTQKYAVCPECGSKDIENGQGNVNVVGSIFTRSCKCGYAVTLNKRNNELNKSKKVQQPIKNVQVDTEFRGIPF